MRQMFVATLAAMALAACGDTTEPRSPSAFANQYTLVAIDRAALPRPITLNGEDVSIRSGQLSFQFVGLEWTLDYSRIQLPEQVNVSLVSPLRLVTRDSLVFPSSPGIPEFFAKVEGSTLTVVVIPTGQPNSMGALMGGAHTWTFEAAHDSP